ncbi:MAG: signal peptidase I [Clostridia bacterium]|nr:signal peptidase I [Clostridia bacterium]
MTRFRRILHIVSHVLFGVALGLLVLIALLITVNNLAGNGRTVLGGFGFARVATGSMEPDIPTGSFILFQQTDVEALVPGDVITFWSDDPKIPSGYPVSHRIVRIEETDGVRTFITKGTANSIEDPYPVYGEDVVGKVIWHSALIGWIIGIAQSTYTLPILIVILLCCLVFNAVNVVKEAKKLSDASNAAAVEAARQEALQELQETYGKSDTLHDP